MNNNLSNNIKYICFILISICNAGIGVLINQNIIKFDSPILIISSVITSILLMVASKSDVLIEINEKLHNGNIKMEELQNIINENLDVKLSEVHSDIKLNSERRLSMYNNCPDNEVVNIDKLTYAGNLESLQKIANNSKYHFRQYDICNSGAIDQLFQEFQPIAIFHLAAESHVDRSIIESLDFIHTNIVGTHRLLESALKYFKILKNKEKEAFRFIHISTDEVFGSLGSTGYFNEHTAYDPRSPYSASKASSDLLVRAWHHTYQLPIIITNCTNNYGPFHYPEKLIPLVINNALRQQNLPIYGNGTNIRDWLYVDDHVLGLVCALKKGIVGESYCIGGHNERTNLEVVQTICTHLDIMRPLDNGKSYHNLITYVTDRAGHDFRYAMDPSKIMNNLGWQPQETFESGIKKTVAWYLENQDWVNAILNKH